MHGGREAFALKVPVGLANSPACFGDNETFAQEGITDMLDEETEMCKTLLYMSGSKKAPKPLFFFC